MNDFPLIDFTKPHFMTQESATFYADLYRRILMAKAEGRDIREAMDVSQGQHLLPKETSFREGINLPTGTKTPWGEDQTYDWTWREGVATVEFIGPVVRRGGALSAMSGIAGTQHFARQITEAQEHPEVKAVIAYFDTPGGDSAGLPETAEYFYSMRGNGKPMVAYVDASCCSAGMYLAAAFSEIVVAPNAIVGSIGAVYAFLDASERLKAEGFQKVIIKNSQSPKKYLDPVSKEGREEMQRLADEGAEIFAEAIAKFRGVSMETVWNDFGQGGVLTGRAAAEVGLVDRVGNYEGLLAELASGYVPAAKNTELQTQQDSEAPNLEGEDNMLLPLSVTKYLQDTGWIAPAASSADPAPADATADPVAPEAPDAAGAGTPEVDPRDAELAQLRARTAQLELDRTNSTLLAREQSINSFMTAAAPKITPAMSEEVKVLYTASMDGKVTPAMIETVFSKLPDNVYLGDPPGATNPATAAPKPAQQDANGDSEEPVSAERQRELLESSNVGREVLAAQTGAPA